MVPNPSRPAFEALEASGWHVLLGRRLVTARPIPTAALVAFAAVLVARDRWQSWSFTEHRERGSLAQPPPGGWAALIGVDPETWKAALAAAKEAGLLQEHWGEPDRPRRQPVPLLWPALPPVLDGEQFARAPAAVLFDARLSWGARRLYLVLALHANRNRIATVRQSILIEETGLSRRGLQKALAALKAVGAVEVMRSKGRYSARRYRLKEFAAQEAHEFPNSALSQENRDSGIRAPLENRNLEL